jgi:predicted nucleic-acid-binding protein
LGWEAVKLTADTNVLVRVLTEDDREQSRIAEAELAQADGVALALPALCELVWVLSRGYKVPAGEIAEAIRRLIDSASVMVDRPAVEAGLAVLASGGDFADGVIAHEGRWLGAEVFVSFDRKAVALVEQQGEAARLLA